MTAAQARLRLGIIGAGRATAQHHLPALAASSQVDVVALADVDADRLRATADAFHIGRRLADAQQLIELPDIDAVAVCTPPETHAALAMAAISAGKHTFIEKPLALELAACGAIMATAETSNVKTMVGFNLRGHRLMRQLHRLIAQGVVGAVQAARVVYASGFRHRERAPGWRNDLRTGGGVIFEVGSHGFDLLRYLLDSEFDEVYATQDGDVGAASAATVAGNMRNGVQFSALFADATGDDLEVDIYGAKGRLHLSGHRFDGLEFYPVSVYPGSLKVRMQRFIETGMSLPTGLRVMRSGGDFAGSYRTEWEDFARAIVQDQPAVPGLLDGRAALQAALATVQAVRKKGAVIVAEIAESAG